MKNALISFLLALTASSFATPPSTVPFVDLNQYAGLWYEIARYPQWFEKDMTHVTATYTLKDDYMEVINRGLKKGKWKDVKGKAFITENTGNAKLRIQFFWPFRGDYWIIDLAPDYSWTVISNSRRSTLWILARTPQMDEKTLVNILHSLRKREFDLSILEFVNQHPLD